MSRLLLLLTRMTEEEKMCRLNSKVNYVANQWMHEWTLDKDTSWIYAIKPNVRILRDSGGFHTGTLQEDGAVVQTCATEINEQARRCKNCLQGNSFRELFKATLSKVNAVVFITSRHLDNLNEVTSWQGPLISSKFMKTFKV